jgi:HEAT repeat protein
LAIFGIGVLGDSDSEELRLNFLDHLNDSFLDPRMEAATALGKRHDKRLAKPLIEMLRKNGALNGIVEAARGLLEMSDTQRIGLRKNISLQSSRNFPTVFSAVFYSFTLTPRAFILR